MINANNSIITVISTLVGQMTPLCTITNNAASGNNWQLDMCATYWLNVGSKVTIGGVVFTVESYEKNVSITVSGVAQPIGATFNLTAPKFAHGSHRKVESERKSPTDLTLPFVYLPVPEVTESNEISSDIAYTASIRPIFLMEYNKRKDEIELQQSEVIEPCNEMADFFAWLIQDQQENFERPEGMTRKEWMNFGDPTTWGNDKLIFDQALSGVELRMSLEVSYDAPCLCAAVDPVICAPVTMTWNDAAIEPTNSGGTKDIKTVDAADGVTPVGTKTTDTGAELIVEVSVGGDPVDTEFNSTPTGVSTPGGSTLAINTVDEDDVNVGTLGTNTATEKKITIADSNISNSDDTYSVDLAAEADLEIPDITVTDSDGSTSSFPAVKDVVCTAVPAALNTASLYKTGVTVSVNSGDDGDLEQGQGADFWNLDQDNPFGNTKILTGTSGGYYDEVAANYKDVNDNVTTKALAFPSDLVCNWRTYDQVGATVLVYELTPQSGVAATVMQNAPYTRNGWAGFYVCNFVQLLSIFNWGSINAFMCYPPFDFVYTNTNDRIMSSTRASASFYMTYIGNGAQFNQVSSNLYKLFICRETTLTELGL